MISKRVQAQGQSPPPLGPRPVAQERGREKAKEREGEWIMDVCSKTFVSLSLSQRREECQKEEKWRSEEKERGKRGGAKESGMRSEGAGEGRELPKPSEGRKKKEGE